MLRASALRGPESDIDISTYLDIYIIKLPKRHASGPKFLQSDTRAKERNMQIGTLIQAAKAPFFSLNFPPSSDEAQSRALRHRAEQLRAPDPLFLCP